MDFETHNGALDDLDVLAVRLRAAFDVDATVEQRTRLEWTESKLQVIELLVKARRKIGDNEAFGTWLARNDLDNLSKDDRAAAISLGQDMDLCQTVLLDSDSISLRVIWAKNKWRYEKAVPEGENGTFTLRTDAKSETPEKATQEQALAVSGRGAVKTGISPLIKLFGPDAGNTILSHFDRKTRTTKRIIDKLSKEQGRKLADFIKATPALPKPHNSDGDLGVATLWPKAPHALVSQFRTGRSEAQTLMWAIDRWREEISPLYADWVAAGMPADSNHWYARKIPPQVAAARKADAQAKAEAAISQTVAGMVAELDRPRIDPSCRATHKGPIRHHGAQIWPPPQGEKYSFDDAWYTTMIWRHIDRRYARAEPSPKTRAAEFMKPIIGCFRNLNPHAGEVFVKLLWAQDASPNLTGPEDNECPPYDNIQ